MTAAASESTADLIERFERGPRRVTRAVSGLPGALIVKRADPQEWSVQEVLAHLADNAVVAAWRVRIVLAEDRPVLTAYDQDAWAWPYGRVQAKDSLATLRVLRRTTAGLLRKAPATAWDRTGIHDERGAVSLRDLVAAQVSHLEEHLAQIAVIRRRLRERG